MRNNKILASAIAAALASSLGAGGAGAADLYKPASATATTATVLVTSPPIYVVTEAIGKDITPIPSTGNTTCQGSLAPVTVNYKTANKLNLNTAVKITLTENSVPSSKAVFGYPGLSTSTLAGVVASKVLSITDSASGTEAHNVVLKEGGLDKASLTFQIQTTTAVPSGGGATAGSIGVDAGSTLAFNFCIDKTSLLQTAGSTIGLKIEFPDFTTETGASLPIVSSKSGLTVTINEGKDKNKVKVDVGGEAGSTKFKGSSLGETAAILGKVCFTSTSDTSPSGSGPFAPDLVSSWDPTVGSTAVFKVTDNAPFNASQDHTIPTLDTGATTFTTEQIDKVRIFFESDSTTTDGKFDATLASPPTDFPATTFDLTTATFSDKFGKRGAGDETVLSYLDGNGTQCVNLVFTVNGTTAIDTYDAAPNGLLTFTVNGTSIPFSGRLNHIKRSGTRCTLYNVPSPEAIENANIRITNKSGTADGTLRGTLILPDGTTIFKNEDLTKILGAAIGANQTVYINTKKLDEFARTQANPKWTQPGWGNGRTILRLETNLEAVEMMGLVRDNDVQGAPLTNMSVGASGDGCD